MEAPTQQRQGPSRCPRWPSGSAGRSTAITNIFGPYKRCGHSGRKGVCTPDGYRQDADRRPENLFVCGKGCKIRLYAIKLEGGGGPDAELERCVLAGRSSLPGRNTGRRWPPASGISSSIPRRTSGLSERVDCRPVMRIDPTPERSGSGEVTYYTNSAEL